MGVKNPTATPPSKEAVEAFKADLIAVYEKHGMVVGQYGNELLIERLTARSRKELEYAFTQLYFPLNQEPNKETT